MAWLSFFFLRLLRRIWLEYAPGRCDRIGCYRCGESLICFRTIVAMGK
ncbi:hypothetical protein B4168_1787 [Anoxybacillus flavithermus]|nr:hypothetical protein B4168_1787 [Anoxybacillus flavithermus]OAO84734.1 hypothetical protein GT23_3339 [Parageobacillus thermoglucosidasius]